VVPVAEQLDKSKNESAALADELKRIKDALMCQVCSANAVDKVIIPCGHLLCAACTTALLQPKCPFCRQPFQTTKNFNNPIAGNKS
jgi:phage FluMu protein Com